MERSLALMCGAGVLPARMASEARRQGWRVVAFAFADAPGVDTHAARTIPASIRELGPVLDALRDEHVSAALFGGKFWMSDVLQARDGDVTSRRLAENAASLADVDLAEVVTTTFGAMGITVLDQRPFVGDWLAAAGQWSARAPSAAELDDVRQGFRLARALAEARVGQTVVLRRGVVTAVEAIEGTTETIRRGTTLAGSGAVVVKAVAREQDYRFDTPTLGPETIGAAVTGDAAVVAFQANAVLVLDRAETVRRADAAGIAFVGIDDVGA